MGQGLKVGLIGWELKGRGFKGAGLKWVVLNGRGLKGWGFLRGHGFKGLGFEGGGA